MTSETIESRASFDFVRYANCWEDADLLFDALDVGPDDRVLSVGSAGDNALALLSEGAEVVAVDLSPAQLACIELRRAAFRHLDYDELLRFLGIESALDRPRVYHQLKHSLPSPARRFWNRRLEDIRDGIIHCGKFEEYFELFRRWALPLVHDQATIYALLQPRSRRRRLRFYRQRWNTRRWRWMFRMFFGETLLGQLGRDPEFFRYVDGPVSEKILERTRHALVELPTHNNPYLEYILTGNFSRTLPPYLERERFEKARKNLDNLTVVEGSLDDVARDPGFGPFDAFNLSDVFEYLDEASTRAMLEALTDAATPGARLAYWNMLVPRYGHRLLPNRLEPLRNLSRQLFARDRAFFYGDFIVEEVSR